MADRVVLGHGFPGCRDLRQQRRVGLFGIDLRQIASREALEILCTVLEQRFQHISFCLELMHQTALADTAFARDGVERELARAVAGNDGERRLDGRCTGAFRAGWIVHKFSQEQIRVHATAKNRKSMSGCSSVVVLYPAKGWL